MDYVNYFKTILERKKTKGDKPLYESSDMSRLFKPDTYGFQLYKSYPFDNYLLV